ncbi:hypothetical protein AWJ20_1404 [Sugiyamaella lignohabitans]|uniref:FIST domain-containing protein n=1 Tax=Sugiyamaella lignohabitans TaxID=796027 RepID=A0A167DP33_9ASCO|nr:uncharacterized protein AWJ20_1404 [Sugiyamaella lignohabitans]ANB13123.1 hypothetical protein AWJ20_1404 [Sugiyamaella lignohabitans]
MLARKLSQVRWARPTGGRTVASRLISSSAFTVVNPTKPLQTYLARHIEQLPFKPSSLILAVSPELSPVLPDLVADKSNGDQVIGVTCDAVPPASQRNAFSACFFGSRAVIDDASALSDGLSQIRNERGVTVGRVNWALSSSFFSIEIGGSVHRPGTSLVLPTANTIFNTGSETTMLYRENDTTSPLLSSLKLRLHTLSGSDKVSKAFTSPLVQIARPQMTITSAVDNMIKTIDNTSAAHFLQSSPELMDPENLTTRDLTTPKKVFAEVFSSKTNSVDRFEVIAGGGGEWSPRSAMLVLEPRAQLSSGDKITFYFAKTINDSQSYLETTELTGSIKDIESQSSTAFVLECAPVMETLDTTLAPYKPDTVLANVFGLGSEQGFLLDDVKHSVNCEVAILK